MPIFEYECRGCKSRFDLLVNASTKPECPSCHGSDLTKQLSVFSVGKAAPSPSGSAGPAMPGPCGSCGDPRGPGSCRRQ